MQMTLDKRLPIPLYHQLNSIILDAIQSGHFKADEQLATESDLAQAYGVSKTTVREALRELVDQGYIRREQGRGTFVSRARLEQGPHELTSFTEEMRRRRIKAGSRILEACVVPADPATAEKLDVSAGAEVFILRRVRLADGEPIGLQTSHVPLEIAPGLPDQPMENVSLYEILQKKFDLQPARARETHFAVLLNAEDAKLLNVAPGFPALAAERIAYLESGRPLEVTTSIMRGDRYRVVLDLVAGARTRK